MAASIIAVESPLNFLRNQVLKLLRLIKICLNETYSKVRIGKYLSDNFPIQNRLKQKDAL
jgi:hypothetical protein